MAGRRDEATELMDGCWRCERRRAVRGGDRSRDAAFLGNFPQGLTHLALITAADALVTEDER